MKALLLTGENTLALKDVSPPEPKAGELLVDVELTSIGGSEYMALANPGIRPLPHIMGHGIVGTTPQTERVAVYPLRGCENCSYCKTGLAQLCDDWTLIGVHSDGGFAQKVAVPEVNLVKIPLSLSWKQTAFIEPFANSINAFERAQVKPEDSIAIVGAGGLGLGLVASAKDIGCEKVVVSDLSETRRQVAAQLGASHTSSSLEGQFDIVFETFGSAESRSHALELTRKGGRCVFMGFATANLEVDILEIIRHQKQLLGSFVYSLKQFRKAMRLAEACSPEWVTDVTFCEVEPLLRSYLNDDFRVVKAALRPNRPQ